MALTLSIMKNKIIILTIFASFLLAGCSDFLEETAFSKFDKSEAFKNPTLVYLNTVAAVYSNIMEQGLALSNTNNYYLLSEFSSDLAMMPTRLSDWLDGGARQALFLHTWSTSYSVFNRLWTYNYGQIARCNTAIDEIQSLIDEIGDPDGAFAAYQYELRGLRAYYYYLTCNIWGDVPIVTSSSQSVSDVSQKGRDQVYEFIRDELAESIPFLPEAKSANSGSEFYGRFTKAAGYFLMAKLAANAPVFSHKTWWDGSMTGGFDAVEPTITSRGSALSITLDGTTRNAWETVVYCYEQIADQGYALEPNFKTPFLVGNEGSIENVWVRPNDVSTYKLNQHSHWWGYHSKHSALYNPSRLGGNGNSASIRAAKIFGVKYDPVKGASSAGYDAGQPGYNPAMAAEDYSEADPRWDLSFYYGDFEINGQRPSSNLPSAYATGHYMPFQIRVHMQYPNQLPAFSSDPEWANYIVMWSGARPKKVEIDKTDVHTQFAYYSNADIVVFRYADIMLLAAEAKYRMGDHAGAMSLINTVRNRVGATPVTAINMETISNERALELMWEPTRREDQIRYGTYTEATEDKNPETLASSISGADWKSGYGWTYDNQGVTLVFPIPTSVLNLNTNLVQNYGY